MVLGIVFLFGTLTVNAVSKSSDCADKAMENLEAFEDMGAEFEDGGANYVNDYWADCMGYEV